MEDTFTKIYQENLWRSDESASGHGSTLDATEHLRRVLPGIFEKYGIKDIVDVPCGDYNWWKEMDLPGMKYLGLDVVVEIIERNRMLFGDENHRFDFHEITQHDLGTHDMIFVRDLLGHLSNREVKWALDRIRSSKSKYLMATTFPMHHPSGDLVTGNWRPINLEEFWGLGPAVELVSEQCNISGFGDKSMGIWRLR